MTTSNEMIIANAVSGKTARPCDCCIKQRARWYCPSDDAFLCQGCDGSVHSANPLARRHERVHLKTASLRRSDPTKDLPTWHRGLTRKTRTPRHAKHSLSGFQNPSPTVPELGCEDTTCSSHDCEPEDRVPIFDPSDLDDLEEFAADVETLLGTGLDDELCGIDELGFLEFNDDDDDNDNDNDNDFGEVLKQGDNGGEMIKAESDDVALREPFDLSFVYDDEDLIQDFQEVGGVLEEKELCKLEGDDEKEIKEMVGREKMTSLRLDYEAISEAWATQGSPWISGQRPHINLHDSWPHCLMGTIGAEMSQQYYGQYQIGGGQGGGMGDGEREARVSRYREKRRTRLFSKKIRYEVRKLNAEKRPRMKGRFVKRSSTSFPPTSTSFPLLSK